MTHAATVAAIYEAFGRGDIPAILERISEDVQRERPGVDHGIPWLEPGRGKAHVLRFFEALGAMSFEAFEVTNILEHGATVVGLVSSTISVKASGQRFSDDEAHVWTFGADGRVAAFRHLCDTVVHKRAAGG